MKILGNLRPIETAEEPRVNVVAEPVSWPGDGLAKSPSNIPAARHEHDLGDNIAKEEHAAVNRRAQERADRVRHLAQLQQNLDRAEDRLFVADRRKAWLVKRAADLRAQIPALWSTEQYDVAVGVQPVPVESQLIEIHTTIKACDDAIASYDRVRQQLVGDINGAKVLLDNFQRDHEP